MGDRGIFVRLMKKTFPLRIPDKTDSRVIAAIKVTLNKYVKRERGKVLPTGADRWDFQCRVGANCETAEPCQLAEISAGIEAVAFAEHPEIYGPQFGGYDPTEVARGVTQAGNPLFFVVADQRLYLFSREANRDAFAAEPDGFLAQAKARWPELERGLAQ